MSLFKAANATNQELRAVASELEYFIRTRKVILKGKPKIWRGRELLQGEVIEVFLDTNEIKVRGARGVMEPASGNPPATGVKLSSKEIFSVRTTMNAANTNENPVNNLPSGQLMSKNLMRKFDGRVVVKDVSFHVRRGEIVGLLGPNGAGKTTSFYMTVGSLAPTSGRVEINGTDITDLPIHKRARLGIGYLPQNASVFRKLTVEENIIAVMEVWGIPRAQRKVMLERLIEQFGVGHIRKSLGISLSGGERRRLEIARTLVMSPHFCCSTSRLPESTP